MIIGVPKEIKIGEYKLGAPPMAAQSLPSKRLTSQRRGNIIGKMRKSNAEIAIFDSSGLAIQSIICAEPVYEKAWKKRNALYLNSFNCIWGGDIWQYSYG